MQEQGVRHDDPEYLKAHNLLSAVQRQQVFQRQRQFAQQQIQQRQQQQNGATPDVATNGVHGKAIASRVFIRTGYWAWDSWLIRAM